MVYSKSINEILKLYTRSFLLQFLYSTETQSLTDSTPVHDTKRNTDKLGSNGMKHSTYRAKNVIRDIYSV